MKNRSKKAPLLAELPFACMRVLGERPQIKKAIDAWPDTLGSFIEAFGIPEFEMHCNSILVFWNFFNEAEGEPLYFTCYCRIPGHYALTPESEVEVAICGGRAARDFCDWFIGHHIAVANVSAPKSFLIGKDFQIRPPQRNQREAVKKTTKSRHKNGPSAAYERVSRSSDSIQFNIYAKDDRNHVETVLIAHKAEADHAEQLVRRLLSA